MKYGTENPLVDSLLFIPQLIEERNGRKVAKGVFAEADIPTANKRIYRKHIWERELKRLEPDIKKRRIYGQLDHPASGKTTLQRVSHLITDLSFDGKQVTGEWEILNTPDGKILQAIVEAGGSVGASSRGLGSTIKDVKGDEIVQDDYRLITFDCVGDPANVTAWPDFKQAEDQTGESQTTVEAASAAPSEPEPTTTSTIEEEAMPEITLETLQKEHPALVSQLIAEEVKKAANEARKTALTEAAKDFEGKQETLRQSFMGEISEALANEREGLKEEIEAKLRTDPEVAGAKTVLEDVKKLLRPFLVDEDTDAVLNAKEAEMAALEGQLAEHKSKVASFEKAFEDLLQVTEATAYELYLERAMTQLVDEDVRIFRDRIVNQIGDVSRFENLSEFKTAFSKCVGNVLSECTERASEGEEIVRLKEENEKLHKAAMEALEVSRVGALRAYLEQRLHNEPRAPKIRELFEAREMKTREEVDAFIAEFTQNNPLSEDYDLLSSRLAKGRSTLPEHEHRQSTNGSQRTVAGVSTGLINELAGVGQ